MRDWRIFAALLAGSKRLLAIAFALAICQALLLVPIGLIVRRVFDTTIPESDRGELLLLGTLMLALYAASAVVALATRYLVLRTTKAAVTELRSRLLERLHMLPPSYFDRRDLGALHASVVNDTERLDVMSVALLGMLVPATVVLVGLSGALAVLNPALFALLLTVAPVLILLGRSLGARVRERTRTWMRAFELFSSGTLAALRGMSFAKSHAVDDLVVARQRALHAQLGASGRAMAWLQAAYTQVTGAIAAATGVLVLLFGGLAVIDGRMTIGDLLLFYALAALLRTQTVQILVAAPLVLAGRESLARVAAILDEPAREPYAGTRAIHFSGALAAEDVSFAYDPDRPLLDGVSLTLAPGEVVALVGPNGVGKSTLARLLVGLLRPQAGRVLADGVPLEELDLRALRRRIAVVEQDPYILPGTIHDNLVYAAPHAGEQQLREAVRLAGATAFVDGLPQGWQTPVGDDGLLLSGGQRQTIALARALARTPALLILDEPTTSLDDRAVGHLVALLRRLPGHPAVLVITHTDAVTSVADRSYLLSGGHLTEGGAGLRLASSRT